MTLRLTNVSALEAVRAPAASSSTLSNAFQSEDGLVKGMWVNRSICAVRIYGAKLKEGQQSFITSLGEYVILKGFENYVKSDSD